MFQANIGFSFKQIVENMNKTVKMCDSHQ